VTNSAPATGLTPFSAGAFSVAKISVMTEQADNDLRPLTALRDRQLKKFYRGKLDERDQAYTELLKQSVGEVAKWKNIAICAIGLLVVLTFFAVVALFAIKD